MMVKGNLRVKKNNNLLEVKDQILWLLDSQCRKLMGQNTRLI